MLAGGYSWRLFFYVEFAFGCALLILAFFVVEETFYHRKASATESSVQESASSQQDEKTSVAQAAVEDVSASAPRGDNSIPPRKTFLQTLKFWGVYDKDTEFFMMIARSFTYFLVPHVLWVITTYGQCPFASINRSTSFFSPFRPSENNINVSSRAIQEYISASAPSPSTTRSRSRSRHRLTTGRRHRPA